MPQKLKSMLLKLLTCPLGYVVFLSVIVLLTLNIGYPIVGSDYVYYVPRLLDSYLFYLNNGLAIQWWTPSFAGGLPSYPNPQQMQFTPQQALLFFMNPWVAINLTVALYLVSGFYSMFFLLLHDLSFPKEQAILGATFFSVTGFYLEHLAAGHLGYVTFPLLPLALLCLLTDRLPLPLAALGLALILTNLIHAAGFYLLVIFTFALMLTLLLIGLLTEPSRKSLVQLSGKVILGGMLGMLLSSSKFVAIASFMRYFPRLSNEHYAVPIWQGVSGFLLQLFFTPLALFQPRVYIGNVLRYVTGARHGLWELDIGLSPVVAGVLCLGVCTGLLHRRARDQLGRIMRQKWGRVALLLALSWIGVEFCLAKGFFYDFLKPLPFLRSLRSNVRFAAIFILPLNILAIYQYAWFARRIALTRWGGVKLTLTLAGLTLALYSAYLQLPFRERPVYAKFDIRQSLQDWRMIRQQHANYRVNYVGRIGGDSKTFSLQASNLYSYEPILSEYSPYLKEGAVAEHDGQAFNLTNPASLVFPAENQLRLFERIALAETANFEQFVTYRRPTWKLSASQRLANTISSGTAAALPVCWLGYWYWRKFQRKGKMT